jgi:HlyD family secretion protein
MSNTPNQPPRNNQKNRRRARRWIPYTGALILAALITAGLWPKPSPVETGTATRGPLRSTVDEEGKTRIRQRYMVSAPVTGYLQRVPFKPGAAVEANSTILATLRPTPSTSLDPRSRATSEANLALAQANLEKARAANDYAQRELQRISQLVSQNTLPEQELDAATWRERDANQSVQSALAAIQQAKADLAEYEPNPTGQSSPTKILAPVSGQILRVFEESSRVVPAGTPILEIGDPLNLEAVIECLSRDAATMTPGMTVLLERWGGGSPLQGSLRHVEPAAFTKISALGVEEQRVNVIVDILTPPQDRPGVGDNFRVEARIVTWESENTLKIPAGALFRRGQQWTVFTIENGRATLRPVETGHSNGKETEIISGLSPNDTVILYPGERVQNHSRVRPVQI